jgi:hypothetical protein
MSTEAVRLVRADASLLMALTESGGGRARLLRDLIGDYDWLERGIPTFDEASFGLPRLAAARYLDVGRTGDGLITVRATARARALRASIRATTLGGVLSAAAVVVGAAPYPEPEVEDRHLGRLAGLDAWAWEAEVDAYHSAFTRELGACLIAPVAVGIGAAALAGLALVHRRRNR